MPAVEVRGASKSYVSGSVVLNNMDMTVPKGCIYGLLGSSGCGKTSILSCIVGLRRLNSGTIHVFGRPVPGSGIPGKRLGYMPQDIALYPHFTIREILLYFGRIYGMHKSDILKREEFLTSFLQLPSYSKRISSLSGGQQRRISLAVALVGSPELVVLDEPTVGLDPMLRNSIWDHLCQMVKNGRTTVIITTHYTEEVRRAHMIGLMRHGRMLTESSPENLLRTFNAPLLEDIVLELCRRDHHQHKKNNDVSRRIEMKNDLDEQESSSSSSDEDETKEKNMYRSNSKTPTGSMRGLPFVTNSKKFSKPKSNDFVAESQNGNCIVVSFNDLKRENQTESVIQVSTKRETRKLDTIVNFTSGTPIQRIYSLIQRNLIFFSRNLGFLFILLIYPGLQTALVASTIGGDPKNMSLAVVNQELPDWREYCTHLSHISLSSCDAKPYSCRFLNKLENGHVKLVPFATREEALGEAQMGNHYGVLTIPVNYTQHLIDRTVTGNFATNETLDGTTIRVRLDNSNYVASLLITRNLYSSLENYAMEVGESCGKLAKEFEIPLAYKPVYGRLESKYTEYVTPGALVIILFLIPLSGCGLAFVSDKRQGTMDRSMAAGVTTFEIMIAFFVTDALSIILQTVISTAIMVHGFDFTVEGSYALYGLLCFLTGLCGQSWGFVLGILCPDEWTLLLSGFSLHFPLLIQGGIIWPLDGINIYAKYLSHCLPVTASLHSMRSIISRGVGITNIGVWPGFIILSIWIIAAWCVAIVKYKSLRK